MNSSVVRADPGSTLVLSRNATADGLSAPLRSRIAQGQLKLVRRGVYTDAAAFAQLDDTASYRTRVLATLALRPDAVVTSYSAAVFLGLPMIGKWPKEVYLLSGTSSGRRRNGVVELGRRGGESIVETDGRLMTSIPYTLLHICRTARFVSALAIVDAAVHIDRFDRTPALITIAELAAYAAEQLPFPGSIRAARVLRNATTLADNSFETLSRVAIDELGFPQPILQHKLYLPLSNRYVFTDFAWLEHALAGEADGLGKYLGGGPGPVKDPAQTVIEEKQREDEIRGLGLAVARWGWKDALRRTPLKAILLQKGLPLVRRPRTYV
ncbi:hypothetical protein [Rathayibacter soli]|uniref:hypothetical protein n=1 Tax=Rathayibacter soli TaxID=3144168 RepID=UPI0027E3DB24|nr:hypothetical protein [Glaciibacter superstes]